ncbi:hypothetical protein [Mycobacteroides abscessus]|uniref:hypothetical protein n=1 Tax=Mycobacteroides abscessus TaxID=36809 RepID=UPI0018782203
MSRFVVSPRQRRHWRGRAGGQRLGQVAELSVAALVAADDRVDLPVIWWVEDDDLDG